MKPRRSPPEPDCREVRRRLETTWSDGELDALDSGHPPAQLAAHLEACEGCRREAESLMRLEHRVTRAFQWLKEQEALPDDEAFSRMIRRLDAPAAAWVQRKTRRALRPVIWLAFFLFTLLAFAVLAAVAGKALFGG